MHAVYKELSDRKKLPRSRRHRQSCFHYFVKSPPVKFMRRESRD